FLTEHGWQPLAAMEPGMRIGVPRVLPVFGDQELPEHEITLLAYLLADGGLTQSCPAFTNTNQRLLDEFSACVAQFGGLKTRRIDSAERTPTLRVSADKDMVAGLRSRF